MIHRMTLTVCSEHVKPEYLERFHELCIHMGEKVHEGGEDYATYAELDVDAEGYCIPFMKGCMYLRNGDVGYPDEGGYCEEIELLAGKIDITCWLHDYAEESLRDKLYENFVDDLRSEPDYE